MNYKLLTNDAIGVIATDTIYGLVGRAMSAKAVARIYKVRKRDPKKPLLILISSLKDLEQFEVDMKKVDLKTLRKYWPGKVTAILPLTSKGIKKFTYLHRGQSSLAFRLPKKASLLSLLKKTGPLVAPSANLSGQPPAMTIEEAKGYFGEKVDFYAKGVVSKKPSKIISLLSSKVEILRK